jgi:hypothetical protein
MPRPNPTPTPDAQALRLHAELLSMPARYLRELPVATRIVAHHAGMNREIVLWSGATAAPTQGAAGFDGDELHAIACGVEAERLRPWDFTGFCLLKQHDPRFRLTERLALAGAQRAEDGPAWPLGRVFERVGLVLIGVVIAEPAQIAPTSPTGATDRDARAA